MADTTDDVVIGAVRKNSRETLVVGLQNFRGHDLLGIRAFADDGRGGRIPTRAGLSIRLTLLDDVIALLTRARDEAKARGLLP